MNRRSRQLFGLGALVAVVVAVLAFVTVREIAAHAEDVAITWVSSEGRRVAPPGGSAVPVRRSSTGGPAGRGDEPVTWNDLGLAPAEIITVSQPATTIVIPPTAPPRDAGLEPTLDAGTPAPTAPLPPAERPSDAGQPLVLRNLHRAG